MKKEKTKAQKVRDAFMDKKVLGIAKSVLETGNVCEHCLGRQLARVSTGLTNKKRGEIILGILDPSKKKKKTKNCSVCRDVFGNLQKFAEEALKKLKKVEFDTFVVGTRLNSGLVEKEESLWESVGIEYCEPIKAEINRELGKLIEKSVKKEVCELRPDIVVMLNLQRNRIELDIKPLFIKGSYKKLVRGIPQTKWDRYKESVESIIAAPVMKKTGGESHSMHASGREDIDARCLDWRPFVLEIKSPMKRKIDLKKIESSLKQSKKVEVTGLRFSDKKEVVNVKSQRPAKSYKVVVEFSKPVKDMEAVKKIRGHVSQRTPARVSHRRADKVRKRRVFGLEWKRINNKKYEFQIKGEAGLYIKELVTGDDKRTKPSISEVLKNPARVRSLDVIKIWE